MQAWWAEENSLKNIKILLFKNFWLVVYASPSFEVKDINKVSLRCLFDSDFTFLVCMKAKTNKGEH